MMQQRICQRWKEEQMTFLDKAKATAQRARGQATHGVERGRTRLEEVQVHRKYVRLLERLGEAYYAEHRGTGTREKVAAALEEVDAYARLHPEVTTGVAPTRAARDIMHAGAECVSESDSLLTAAQKMRDLGVGSMPVCGADDRLHGIITDRDITIRCVAEGLDPATMRAVDLAQGEVFWVDAASGVNEVLREMETHQVKRLPVIENHRLVGVISEADLARNLSEDQLAEFVERVYGTA
jgi:CBS domain-containing protein